MGYAGHRSYKLSDRQGSRCGLSRCCWVGRASTCFPGLERSPMAVIHLRAADRHCYWVKRQRSGAREPARLPAFLTLLLHLRRACFALRLTSCSASSSSFPSSSSSSCDSNGHGPCRHRRHSTRNSSPVQCSASIVPACRVISPVECNYGTLDRSITIHG